MELMLIIGIFLIIKYMNDSNNDTSYNTYAIQP